MTFSPLEPPPVSILASALLAQLNLGSALVHQLLLQALPAPPCVAMSVTHMAPLKSLIPHRRLTACGLPSGGVSM